jgi:threonine dehydrogenase-like Zn-dependent dehydrogenase
MMKGRVVVFKGPRAPFEIQEFDVPDPEPGALVVKITQAGICGTDLHSWRGEQTGTAPFPAEGRTTGHEGTGVVYKLGAGVTTDWSGKPMREGDRVVYTPFTFCNRCHQCQHGHQNWCSRERGPAPVGTFPYFSGTFGDYYYVGPDRAVYRVPDELPDSVLGSVNCAMGCATGSLMEAGTKEGDYVVIQGAGGLGLYAVAMAKDMGAHRVIVIDRLEERLQLAREFGADHTINIDKDWTTPELRRQRVWELTDGRGADVVLEFVGRPELLLEGLEYLTNGGSFVETGTLNRAATVPFSPASIVYGYGKKIVGSRGYRPFVLPLLLEALVKLRGRVPFEKLVSHTFPLERVDDAFAQSEWLDRQTSITRAMLVP